MNIKNKNNENKEISLSNSYKFIAILSLLALFAVSFSAVSGANIYVNNTYSSGSGTINNPYDNIGSAIHDSNNGGANNVIIISDGEYKKSSGNNTNLIISRNVNIYGAKYYYNNKNMNDTIINGENSTRFFKIAPGVIVNIYGINFINGNYKHILIVNNKSTILINIGSYDSLGYGSPGGAIYNEGTLTIINCKFKNNLASNNGGAIYNSGKCMIINSSFINNTALKYIHENNMAVTMCGGGSVSFYQGEGGAIANNNGNLTIKFSNFTSNRATTGAAVYSINNSQLTTESSRFYYNSATDGAIFSCKTSNLIINNSTFLISGKNGEKLLLNEGKATISNNTFYGGFYGIFNNGNAMIEKNHVNKSYIAIQNNAKNVKISSNILNNNGQAIYNTASSTIINGNKISNCPTAIYNEGYNVNIRDNKIFNCTTAIYNEGYDTNIRDNKIFNCTTAIYNEGYNTNIRDNYIEGEGNYGICNLGSKAFIFNNIVNVKVIGIYNTKNNVSISNNDITAKLGIYNTKNNVSISNNDITAKLGIYNKGKHVKIINNAVDSFSGIYNNGSYVIIVRNSLNFNYPIMYSVAKPTNNYGIANTKKNVNIKNNNINNHYYGVYIVGNKNKINNNTITGKKDGYGTYISKKSKYNVLYQNKISKFRYGISMKQVRLTKGSSISNNKIIKNKIVNNKIGLTTNVKFKNENKKNIFRGNNKNIKVIR